MACKETIDVYCISCLNTLTGGSHEDEEWISPLPPVCAPLLIGAASVLSLFHDSLHLPSSPVSVAPALPD